MSVLNDGNNLPGVLVDIEAEISQDYDPSQWGSTDSVLIIGTAFSGPTGVPTQIYNTDMGRYFYGDSYDAETHRSATLVPGIQAAYEAGCRTIWAMRVGGQDIYKDFRLCEENDKYRLRIASIYPTNKAKKCFIKLNVRSGFESITLYKPASKATVAEKKSGIVDSVDSTLVSTILLNEDNGLTRNDKLVDLINLFNSNSHNNVLHLSIVDTDGNDVTTTPEAQELRIGSLFSGIYFIGRDRNAANMPGYTTIKASAIVSDDDPKPYTSYEGAFYRRIEFNSDVASEYPIYAESYSEMKEALVNVGVTAGQDYAFLETTGLASRAWLEDEHDYEDVDLTNFEMYQKLGSGFAVTAKAVERKGLDSKGRVRRPRIIETPADDENRIVGIGDGVYSLLENTEVDYRVLVAVNADDKITARLPKADAFKVATPNSIELLGINDVDGSALVEATPVVDELDLTQPKSYKFHFKKVDEDDVDIDTVNDIYVDKVAKIIAGVAPEAGQTYSLKGVMNDVLAKGEIPSGTLFMVFEDSSKTTGRLIRVDGNKYSQMNIAGLEGELYDIDNKIYVGALANIAGSTAKELVFTAAASDTTSATGNPTYKGKEYILVDNGHTLNVAAVADAAELTVTPLGTLSSMMNDSEAKTLIYVEDCFGKENNIVVTTGAADYIPLDEFVETLQDDETLGKLFTFELTDLGNQQKDMYPEDIEDAFAANHNGQRYFEQNDNGTVVPGEYYELAEAKTVTYDYSKYIPYRTSDNFVRQLAQHCAYSSLRTSMTHGIIGYTPLRSFTLKSIADRERELRSTDFSLYAKKNNGRMLLGADGNPYEIGGDVSVTVFQHDVTDTVNNYTTTVNGAATYAGVVSILPVEQSTTMQPIGINSVGFSFSEDQLRNITNAGFVATKTSQSKGICICDGVTMAPATEFRRRLSIVRTVNACGDAIRTAAEPYIGKKNSLQNRSALKTAIDSALHNLTDTLIWDYTFEIVNLSSYTSDSEIDINYSIFPMNEIRQIDNSITVTHQSTGGNS